MILLDTSGLLAALDASQSHHTAAAASLAAARPPLLLSPFVLAELDYLIATRVGADARASVLEEVERGAYLLETMTSADVASAHTIIKRYAALEISLADASIVVLAERRGVRDVLTLDQRHFRVLTANDEPLRLLPADA
ncbi:MAG TPA: PIN domain-containing protein [Solirubrobacteraceae bacterium]|nr:PIN domain-containing protein [Solirubrobacteraceae bacterium]